MEETKIVLASASPRRKELLLQIGIEPEVIPSRVEERITCSDPAAAVRELSVQKAMDVAGRCAPGTIVIGADTAVAAGGKILGKPKTHGEAYEMVKSLAGRSHQVCTGVTLIKAGARGGKSVTFSETTAVTVYPMTEGELREYAMSDEPMDKAGGYAVQGFFARYIESVSGSYSNVVGLPVGRFYQELKNFEQTEECDD